MEKNKKHGIWNIYDVMEEVDDDPNHTPSSSKY